MALTITGDRIDGLTEPLTATGRFTDDATFVADLGGRQVSAVVVEGDDAIEVRVAAGRHPLPPPRPALGRRGNPAATARSSPPSPAASLPSYVAVGQAVAVGDRLLVLEAMKMEHRLTAKVGWRGPRGARRRRRSGG